MRMPFNVVMIVPTGIGAKIGGHAGDTTVAARLLAGACDTLIVHPNVVNAADFNEMPANSLYVEGSMLDRFLRSEIYLQPVRSNRVLVACNKLIPETQNCAAAARLLLGADVRVIELERPLKMTSQIDNGVAGGEVSGVESLCRQLEKEPFDALAIHTEIGVDRDAALHYMRTCDGVNPWGGVEAILSRRVSAVLGVPVAHAPIETNAEFNEVVPDAISAELISVSMLFSVLKGLHRAPRIGTDSGRNVLSVDDVDALVTPDCWGSPHDSCNRAGIPIIRVCANETNRPAGQRAEFIDVRTYLEAAGALIGLREGIHLNAS